MSEVEQIGEQIGKVGSEVIKSAIESFQHEAQQEIGKSASSERRDSGNERREPESLVIKSPYPEEGTGPGAQRSIGYSRGEAAKTQ